jgi:hypothetical protein
MKKRALTHLFSFRNSFALILALLVFSGTTKAQTVSASTAVNKKFVRVDIGHGALHCPFLSPKIDAAMQKITGIENYFIDKQASYITFNLPANTDMTVESVKKIGTEVGYPDADVIVKFDDKPIESNTAATPPGK